jgi:hypothetical protein
MTALQISSDINYRQGPQPKIHTATDEESGYRSPLRVPIRWGRHSLGRPEVLRKSPELSGGRIYRREQKNI